MEQTPSGNIVHIRQQISTFENKHGRQPGSTQLLAVSKTFPALQLRQAYECGQRDFGESYLQEAVEKINTLSDLAIIWHFIGRIQSNKTRTIAQYFDWVHTVDRLKIAQRLSAQRPVHLPPINICIQVNVSHDPAKGGVNINELVSLTEAIQQFPQLRLRGLMTLPAKSPHFEEQYAELSKLKQAYDQLNRQGHQLDTLSMGMSADFEAAIACGATLVRIGRAIFGERIHRDAD